MPINYHKLYDLSLREKIAQLMLIGFHGSDCLEESEVWSMIQNHKPGGVILFDKDMVHHKPVHNIKSPKQVKELTKNLQRASKLPLLIGVDQEGGLINRLKPEYGFPETKSHQKLGEIDDIEVTTNEGNHIAKILTEAGININFAPCVDLSIEKESSIIAKRERCFGDTSEQVIKHAKAYMDGHHKNRILTACKHFPGHGSATGDTHAGFVNVTDTWKEDELRPYSSLIDSQLCPVIMISHIFNGNFDTEFPATLSVKTIDHFLRKKIGFDGVVISDDMQMRAISDHYDLEESLKLGLEAGLDMFCFGNNLLKEPIHMEEAISAVENLIEKKILREDRIDESVNRILKLKSRWIN
ncbi:MAG: glycoside hydrolase family 3 protein [Balneolaceae bacterium]